MQTNKLAQTKIGECEVSRMCNPSIDIKVSLQPGNIWMCDACRDEEERLTEASNQAKQLIEESRQIDSQIQLKPDIFLAKTVAAIELRAAIEANQDIPAEQKEYFFALECKTRWQNLQEVIFAKRKELLELDNEAGMWQVNCQSAAGKLSADIREKQFKTFNVTYAPKAPKTPKENKSSTPKKAFSAKELKAVSAQFGVSQTDVQMRAVSRNVSIEDAAKSLSADKSVIRDLSVKYGLPEEAISNIAVKRNIVPEEAAKFLAELMTKTN